MVDVRLCELRGARGAAATAAARHRGLGHRDCAVRPDLAGGDTLFAVAEDVALHVSPSARPLSGKGEKLLVGLTAIRLTKPRMKMMMPLEMTTRQKARPSACWLVAGLLRLPSMLMPSTSMAMARATKPREGLRRGQLRAK